MLRSPVGGCISLQDHPLARPATISGRPVKLLYVTGTTRETLLTSLSKEGWNVESIGLDGQQSFSRKLYDRDGAAVISVLHGFSTISYSAPGSQEARWKAWNIVGDFTPKETGYHYFDFFAVGPSESTGEVEPPTSV